MEHYISFSETPNLSYLVARNSTSNIKSFYEDPELFMNRFERELMHALSVLSNVGDNYITRGEKLVERVGMLCKSEHFAQIVPRLVLETKALATHFIERFEDLWERFGADFALWIEQLNVNITPKEG